MSASKKVFAKLETLKGSFIEIGQDPFMGPSLTDQFFVRLGSFNREGVFQVESWFFMFHTTAHAVFDAKFKNVFSEIAQKEGIKNA